jgi:hypothetical protein
MGLLSEITAALAEAFSDPDGLADAVTGFTGSRLVNGAYSPATGGFASNVLGYTGRGVFADYSARDIDGTLILTSDVKLTALQAEVSIVPMVGDKINGKTVMRVSADAAHATHVLQLRK